MSSPVSADAAASAAAEATRALIAQVGDCLTEFLSVQRDHMEAIGDDVLPLHDAVVDLTRGGKRLRPSFAYWGYIAGGGDDGAAIVRACTALELLQACALIHDDVMDGSDTRRGLPSVHRRFAAMHRSNMWHGDSATFGDGAAILVGDVCLSWADELLMGSGFEVPALVRAKTIYDIMRTELMAGQYLDLLEQARGGGSVERAQHVIRYKSAKYTIERPLLMGAALADADTAIQHALSEYGLALGEAFQLRDDVLGVFGDPEQTGKPAGDDIREGKRTVLIELAMQACDASGRSLLNQHLGDPALSPAAVAEVRALLVDCGALADVEQRITDATQAAEAALSHIPEPAKSALHALAVAATARHA